MCSSLKRKQIKNLARKCDIVEAYLLSEFGHLDAKNGRLGTAYVGGLTADSSEVAYSYRKVWIGSTRAARRAGT